MLMLPFMRRMRDTFDYAVTGGAPLLGVNGLVTICHGASNAKAIRNALVGAHRSAQQRLNERLASELQTDHGGNGHGEKTESENLGNGIVRTASADD